MYSLKTLNFYNYSIVKNYNQLYCKFINRHFRNFFKKLINIKKSDMLRHAETQHGDCRTVDNENIIVLQSVFSTNRIKSTEDAEEKGKKDVASSSENTIQSDSQLNTLRAMAESIESVWFYKSETTKEPETTLFEQDFKESSNLKVIAPEIVKRKCSDMLTKKCKKTKHENKALKSRQSDCINDRYDETSYYFENNLRKVYPYYFQFTTFTKGRWVGEKILDVFAREFRAQPAKEYERCIQAGTLSVNNEKVPTDYKLKHNDLLSNIVHRHEVPVTSQSIKIVHMDKDILVVNKPSSIPVHPCGRYRHNTVIFILAKEYNLKNLRTIHRLDRLTSGLLLFGRNAEKARLMTNQISNREVKKEYICRVDGEFPDDIIECTERIEVVSFKIGVCKVSSKGKECTTKFQKLNYNGASSIVLCKPLTGRMHQIRVHLQYLGYPIVNDPLYNHEIFGPNKGRGGDYGGRTDTELIKDLINLHNAENWLGIDGDSDLNLNENIVECESNELPSYSKSSEKCSPDNSNSISKNTVINQPLKNTVATQTGHIAPDLIFNKQKITVDTYCYECTVRYRDPRPQDLVMYLHAWKYKGPGWEYETELPDWAKIE